jgi:mono/diheme cytochrome c family protein
MKLFFSIAAIISISTIIVACGGAKGNDPGEIYMPDMAYSRAYEAWNYNMAPGEHDLKSRGVYFNGRPVPGTMARGDAFSFPIMAGDSGYAQAASWRRTDTTTITAAQMKEAERLYLIQCAICHGANLDGNGPLWKGGDGPFPAAPRNLKDPYSLALPDGQMFHAITYGKGQMGSYASQLKPEQRWWVIDYIRSKQGGANTDTAKAMSPAVATSATGTTADTTQPR